MPAVGFSATSGSVSTMSFEGYQLTICWILKSLNAVSYLTHPSNVNSKRGLQRVQYVHVCTVRNGKYIRKKKPSVAFKKEDFKQAIHI